MRCSHCHLSSILGSFRRSTFLTCPTRLCCLSRLPSYHGVDRPPKLANLLDGPFAPRHSDYCPPRALNTPVPASCDIPINFSNHFTLLPANRAQRLRENIIANTGKSDSFDQPPYLSSNHVSCSSNAAIMQIHICPKPHSLSRCLCPSLPIQHHQDTDRPTTHHYKYTSGFYYVIHLVMGSCDITRWTASSSLRA